LLLVLLGSAPCCGAGWLTVFEYEPPPAGFIASSDESHPAVAASSASAAVIIASLISLSLLLKAKRSAIMAMALDAERETARARDKQRSHSRELSTYGPACVPLARLLQAAARWRRIWRAAG
jgi:hypothetical protein